MSIIAINGKVGSGKDTVGSIIQYLTRPFSIRHLPYQDFIHPISGFSNNHPMHDWKIKKFATKLKQITCMMLGCTMEQLEDQDFKASLLPAQWQNESQDLTYRWFLQTLGTESTREIINSHFWINGLFVDYKSKSVNWDADGNDTVREFPNWIITDLRFYNEYRAVKIHSGITIRVNREKEDKYYYLSEFCTLDELRETIRQQTGEYPLYEYCKNFLVPEHKSETALDDVQFDYVIDNNGTIDELIEKVHLILIQEKII